jgi:hypothetical protein
MRIIEAYLDDNKEFYDFGTRPVTNEIVFDTSTTGTSDYDDFLNRPEVMKKYKNMKSEIVYMTPMEYFEGCAEIFGSSAEEEVSYTKADKVTLTKLMTVLNKYKRTFPLGYINYATKNQEGRHRMLASALYSGWDVKQPVLVVTWYDEEKAKRDAEDTHKREMLSKIKEACDESLCYNFRNIEELEHQIQHELNKVFNVSIDEPDVPFELTTDDGKSEFVVTCKGVSHSFDYEDVNWKVSDEVEDDIDWDSLELELLSDGEDIDTWLKKYLGESLTTSVLNEALENHDTLNPAIWDGDKLKPDVKVAIEEIVQQYVEDSEILSLSDVIDVELLGSNASYNYTEHSDLDIHLVVNMESLSTDPAMVQIACNAERSIFNKAYDISIKGVEVELYVEDVKASTASNGIFSVTNDKWVKVPEKSDIPDFSENDEYLNLLDTWMVRANKVSSSTSKEEVQSFINELYNLRRLSIMTDGEYSHGNLVFKEIRNAGLLQELKDLVTKLASRELSLEGLK